MKLIVDVPTASKILKQGGLVAYPTETFYGLAACADNSQAIQKIFEIKKRDQGKPISLILASVQDLPYWVAEIGSTEEKLIKQYWPGPLTIIFKAKETISNLLTANTGTIAIRVSSLPIARELAKNVGGAITATSANLSGEPALNSAIDVGNKIGSLVDGIVDGGILKTEQGSTIVQVIKNKIQVIRSGVIPID